MARKLAIVERLPGHTEDLGAFAAMALALGYDTHLFFENSDPFQMVDYFRTRLPIGPGQIHDWFDIAESAAEFDAILLNTSFVWLDCANLLEQWNASRRLLVVHHHPEDIELNPHGKCIYLTPAGGEERWIFPMYASPQPPGDFPAGSASAGDAAELPALITLGTFEGKDIAGAREYMKAGGKVLHYDRHKCGHFAESDGLYTQHVGLDGIQLMACVARHEPPMFLWLPIIAPSDYLVCRFTAALITGVDMNCVMVMPERLQEFYGFPRDAVISYSAAVTEPACLKQLRAPAAAQNERRRQLWRWAVERWSRNIENFRALIED